ncbi:MAG: hypothetical protein M1514_02325 [Patescibacteria group bacterium]|nr:hypothetical protein [Patescibacteria group bacterium]
MNYKKSEKLARLLKEKEKVLKKIKYYEEIFLEEKDNEESWPGHATTRYQSAEIDRQVWVDILASLEKQIKNLS